MPRRHTLSAQLARMGFADPAQAERLVEGDLALDIDSADAELLGALADAADPDLALAALARLPRDTGLLAALREDAGLRTRLAAVLGASAALGDHLARHPEGWRLLRGAQPLACPSAADLRAELLIATGADPGAAEPVAGTGPAGTPPGAGQAAAPADPAAALRVAYRQRLLHLAARDLTGQITLGETAAELADLAAAALEAALAIARSQLPAGAPPGPAGRDRDGQMRRARAELCQRRGRDLRRRACRAARAERQAGPAVPTGTRARCAPPPSSRPA